eukprot:gene5098-10200_t
MEARSLNDTDPCCVIIHCADFRRVSPLTQSQWYLSNIFKQITRGQIYNSDGSPRYWTVLQTIDRKMSQGTLMSRPSKDKVPQTLNSQSPVYFTYSSYRIVVCIDISRSIFSITDGQIPLYEMFTILLSILNEISKLNIQSKLVTIIAHKSETDTTYYLWSGQLSINTNISDLLQHIKNSITSIDISNRNIKYPNLQTFLNSIYYYLDLGPFDSCPVAILITTAVMSCNIPKIQEQIAKRRFSLYICPLKQQSQSQSQSQSSTPSSGRRVENHPLPSAAVGMIADVSSLRIICEASGGSVLSYETLSDKNIHLNDFTKIFLRKPFYVPLSNLSPHNNNNNNNSSSNNNINSINSNSNLLDEIHVGTYQLEHCTIEHMLSCRLLEGYTFTSIEQKKHHNTTELILKLERKISKLFTILYFISYNIRIQKIKHANDLRSTSSWNKGNIAINIRYRHMESSSPSITSSSTYTHRTSTNTSYNNTNNNPNINNNTSATATTSCPKVVIEEYERLYSIDIDIRMILSLPGMAGYTSHNTLISTSNNSTSNNTLNTPYTQQQYLDKINSSNNTTITTTGNSRVQKDYGSMSNKQQINAMKLLLNSIHILEHLASFENIHERHFYFSSSSTTTTTGTGAGSGVEWIALPMKISSLFETFKYRNIIQNVLLSEMPEFEIHMIHPMKWLFMTTSSAECIEQQQQHPNYNNIYSSNSSSSSSLLTSPYGCHNIGCHNIFIIEFIPVSSIFMTLKLYAISGTSTSLLEHMLRIPDVICRTFNALELQLIPLERKFELILRSQLQNEKYFKITQNYLKNEYSKNILKLQNKVLLNSFKQEFATLKLKQGFSVAECNDNNYLFCALFMTCPNTTTSTNIDIGVTSRDNNNNESNIGITTTAAASIVTVVDTQHQLQHQSLIQCKLRIHNGNEIRIEYFREPEVNNYSSQLPRVLCKEDKVLTRHMIDFDEKVLFKVYVAMDSLFEYYESMRLYKISEEQQVAEQQQLIQNNVTTVSVSDGVASSSNSNSNPSCGGSVSSGSGSVWIPFSSRSRNDSIQSTKDLSVHHKNIFLPNTTATPITGHCVTAIGSGIGTTSAGSITVSDWNNIKNFANIDHIFLPCFHNYLSYTCNDLNDALLEALQYSLEKIGIYHDYDILLRKDSLKNIQNCEFGIHLWHVPLPVGKFAMPVALQLALKDVNRLVEREQIRGRGKGSGRGTEGGRQASRRSYGSESDRRTTTTNTTSSATNTTTTTTSKPLIKNDLTMKEGSVRTSSSSVSESCLTDLLTVHSHPHLLVAAPSPSHSLPSSPSPSSYTPAITTTTSTSSSTSTGWNAPSSSTSTSSLSICAPSLLISEELPKSVSSSILCDNSLGTASLSYETEIPPRNSSSSSSSNNSNTNVEMKNSSGAGGVTVVLSETVVKSVLLESIRQQIWDRHLLNFSNVLHNTLYEDTIPFSNHHFLPSRSDLELAVEQCQSISYEIDLSTMCRMKSIVLAENLHLRHMVEVESDVDDDVEVEKQLLSNAFECTVGSLIRGIPNNKYYVIIGNKTNGDSSNHNSNSNNNVEKQQSSSSSSSSEVAVEEGGNECVKAFARFVLVKRTAPEASMTSLATHILNICEPTPATSTSSSTRSASSGSVCSLSGSLPPSPSPSPSSSFPLSPKHHMTATTSFHGNSGGGVSSSGGSGGTVVVDEHVTSPSTTISAPVPTKATKIKKTTGISRQSSVDDNNKNSENKTDKANVTVTTAAFGPNTSIASSSGASIETKFADVNTKSKRTTTASPKHMELFVATDTLHSLQRLPIVTEETLALVQNILSEIPHVKKIQASFDFLLPPLPKIKSTSSTSNMVISHEALVLSFVEQELERRIHCNKLGEIFYVREWSIETNNTTTTTTTSSSASNNNAPPPPTSSPASTSTTMLTSTSTSVTRLPCWLVVSVNPCPACRVENIQEDMTVLTVEVTVSLRLCGGNRDDNDKLQDNISSSILTILKDCCRLGNQYILLKSLYDTRNASAYLIAPTVSSKPETSSKLRTMSVIVPRSGSVAPPPVLHTPGTAPTTTSTTIDMGSNTTTSTDNNNDTSSSSSPAVKEYLRADQFTHGCFNCSKQSKVQCTNPFSSLTQDVVIRELQGAFSPLMPMNITDNNCFISKDSKGDIFYMSFDTSTDVENIKLISISLYGIRAVDEKMLAKLKSDVETMVDELMAKTIASQLARKAFHSSFLPFLKKKQNKKSLHTVVHPAIMGYDLSIIPHDKREKHMAMKPISPDKNSPSSSSSLAGHQFERRSLQRREHVKREIVKIRETDQEILSPIFFSVPLVEKLPQQQHPPTVTPATTTSAAMTTSMETTPVLFNQNDFTFLYNFIPQPFQGGGGGGMSATATNTKHKQIGKGLALIEISPFPGIAVTGSKIFLNKDIPQIIKCLQNEDRMSMSVDVSQYQLSNSTHEPTSYRSDIYSSSSSSRKNSNAAATSSANSTSTPIHHMSGIQPPIPTGFDHLLKRDHTYGYIKVRIFPAIPMQTQALLDLINEYFDQALIHYCIDRVYNYMNLYGNSYPPSNSTSTSTSSSLVVPHEVVSFRPVIRTLLSRVKPSTVGSGMYFLPAKMPKKKGMRIQEKILNNILEVYPFLKEYMNVYNKDKEVFLDDDSSSSYGQQGPRRHVDQLLQWCDIHNDDIHDISDIVFGGPSSYNTSSTSTSSTATLPLMMTPTHSTSASTSISSSTPSSTSTTVTDIRQLVDGDILSQLSLSNNNSTPFPFPLWLLKRRFSLEFMITPKAKQRKSNDIIITNNNNTNTTTKINSENFDEKLFFEQVEQLYWRTKGLSKMKMKVTAKDTKETSTCLQSLPAYIWSTGIIIASLYIPIINLNFNFNLDMSSNANKVNDKSNDEPTNILFNSIYIQNLHALMTINGHDTVLIKGSGNNNNTGKHDDQYSSTKDTISTSTSITTSSSTEDAVFFIIPIPFSSVINVTEVTLSSDKKSVSVTHRMIDIIDIIDMICPEEQKALVCQYIENILQNDKYMCCRHFQWSNELQLQHQLPYNIWEHPILKTFRRSFLIQSIAVLFESLLVCIHLLNESCSDVIDMGNQIIDVIRTVTPFLTDTIIYQDHPLIILPPSINDTNFNLNINLNFMAIPTIKDMFHSLSSGLLSMEHMIILPGINELKDGILCIPFTIALYKTTATTAAAKRQHRQSSFIDNNMISNSVMGLTVLYLSQNANDNTNNDNNNILQMINILIPENDLEFPNLIRIITERYHSKSKSRSKSYENSSTKITDEDENQMKIRMKETCVKLQCTHGEDLLDVMTEETNRILNDILKRMQVQRVWSMIRTPAAITTTTSTTTSIVSSSRSILKSPTKPTLPRDSVSVSTSSVFASRSMSMSESDSTPAVLPTDILMNSLCEVSNMIPLPFLSHLYPFLKLFLVQDNFNMLKMYLSRASLNKNIISDQSEACSRILIVPTSTSTSTSSSTIKYGVVKDHIVCDNIALYISICVDAESSISLLEDKT